MSDIVDRWLKTLGGDNGPLPVEEHAAYAERVAAGDSRALTRVTAAIARLVFRKALRYMSVRQLEARADEALSVILEAVWKASKHWTPEGGRGYPWFVAFCATRQLVTLVLGDWHSRHVVRPTFCAVSDDMHGSDGDFARIDAKLDVERALTHCFPSQRLALVEYAAGVTYSEQAKREGRDPEALRQRAQRGAERARKALLGGAKAAVTVTTAACVAA